MAIQTAKDTAKKRIAPVGNCFGESFLIALIAILAVAIAFLPASARAQAMHDGAVDGLTPQFTEVNGIRTRFYQVGHGEPLVLLHGGRCGGVSNSANVWSKNILPLSHHFLVLVPDRPGHGMTQGTTAQCSDEAFQVNWLYHFLLSRGLKKVNLVGHSAGGAVAFFFAVTHPDMIKTLVIVASGQETPHTLSHVADLEMAVRLKSCPKTANTLVNWECRAKALSYAPNVAFNNKQFFETEYSMYLWRLKQGPSYNVVKAVHRHYATFSPKFLAYRKEKWNQARDGVLGSTPVMIFYGKQDPLDWKANEPASQLHGAMGLFRILGTKDPNVSLTVLNHAGHFVYREHPRQFDHYLTSFIGYWSAR